MPKVAPKRGRKFKSDSAPGVYLRGQQYWLRYTFAGEKVRVSLDTEDAGEANKRADKLRGTAPKGSLGGEWKSQLKKYLRAKKDLGKHRPATAEKATYAARSFFAWTKTSSTSEVTLPMVMAYYHAHRTPSLKDTPKDRARIKASGPKPSYHNTATARGYVSAVAAFLRWSGNPLTVAYPSREQVPTKTLVIRRSRAVELIASTPRLDLKYILYAGFFEGLRKEEIIMSRPQWFDLDGEYLNVPAIEERGGRFFETKSGRARKIPLEPAFKAFLLKEFGGWKKQTYMLHPEASGRRYRWDPRQPMMTLFERHGLRKPRYKNLARFDKLINPTSARAKAAKSIILKRLAEAEKAWAEREEMSMHTMRHSFGSHHIRRGISMARVALWLGDRLKTVETNYMHEFVDDGGSLDTPATKAYDALEARLEVAITHLGDLTKTVTTGQMTEAKVIAQAWTESLSKTERWQQDIVEEHLESLDSPTVMDYDSAAGIIDEHDDSRSAKV